MSFTKLPPVPFKTKMAGADGFLTSPWMAWFRQIASTVLEASAIDATSAAAAADNSAIAAASSASAAATSAAGSATSAGTASAAAAGAVISASSAASSAASAADTVADATALMDLVGAQAYSPDYITDTVNVPIHRQLIAFDRVTIASGGSLQIYGRGRIL